MERTWTTEELDDILPRIISRWPGAARLLQSKSAQERLRLVTRSVNAMPAAVTFKDLPDAQVPTSIAKHLTQDNIQIYPTRGSTDFQFRNLTHLELHKSACTPLHIIDICSTFPCLQTLCVYTGFREAKKKRSTNFAISDGAYLSDALAKLPDLKTLDLDLHYNCDFSHLLGPRGVLNLQKLTGLENLVLPLHFLVEKKIDGGHVVTYPSTVLPPSLRRLHLRADRTCLVTWRSGSSGPGGQQFNTAVTGYKSASTLLEFLGAVSACVPYYFTNLELATYTYGSKPPLEDVVGNYSEKAPTFPRGALGPGADVDDNMTRFGVLAEDFERNGVRFDVVLELAAH